MSVPPDPPAPAAVVAMVTLQPSGWRFPVAAGQSVIEAALAQGIGMPRSCRNGTCRTCLCRALSGQVRYRIAWPGLSQDEKDEGLVLPCVALPDGDLVLEVPAARRQAISLPDGQNGA